MTAGTVVILGEVGLNFGAGMTGGEAYVHGDLEELALALNGERVAAHAPDARQLEEVQALFERHHRYTGSVRAAALLEAWGESAVGFVRVAPINEAVTAQFPDEVVSASAS